MHGRVIDAGCSGHLPENVDPGKTRTLIPGSCNHRHDAVLPEEGAVDAGAVGHFPRHLARIIDARGTSIPPAYRSEVRDNVIFPDYGVRPDTARWVCIPDDLLCVVDAEGS